MASFISWAYRIALVGKPSAGKSSLFNALTRAGLARNKFEKTVGGGTVVAKVSAVPSAVPSAQHFATHHKSEGLIAILIR
jgi:ribosome-binding ATPase YchF (GTP1/OBG family)